ncbi:MGDG synthase family glycosyltransferase [Alkalihalobacillus hemicellulosilyticus]|uniref:Diglucosyldiacylglycerol synthase n=1 Tax=Halalkalibacter hemicellulosilyticusJCM 9152 TaxID=1236971 RepID=W4QC50_9BACI|nr:glycosyltransferase [Halalkalibacter hemicellulosilyticus]GAE28934.1 diglucosyldiacylglycerol synthase [Halalkalibacter hemicellulosilyticusJCM 9152]
MKPQPLIFSASIGHGHNQAAMALQHELQKQGFQPKIIDTFYAISPVLHSCMLKSYLHLLKKKPLIWQNIYFRAEKVPLYLYLDRFAMLFIRQLHHIVKHSSCSFMISTHPFVTAFLARLKKQRKLNIPFYTVITDFVLHPAYIRPEIDAYFTMDPNVSEFAKRHNLKEDLFFTTGIPIKSHVSLNQSKYDSRKRLGICENRKVLLIAGGGMGLTNYTEAITSLNGLDEPIQLLCMIGHNRRIKKEIEVIESKHEINVIEFTDDFLLYLKASDAIFSKAGGLTMAESLACETPIIIYNPVPGHEEQNAEFLINVGAAKKANSTQDIPAILKHVLYENEFSMEMRNSARKWKQPNAANDVVERILSLLEE